MPTRDDPTRREIGETKPHPPPATATPAPDLVTATKEIVAAYVAHNNLSEDKLPSMIEAVHRSLVRVSSADVVAAVSITVQEPAVHARKSITDEYIICLEDGKRLKVMTRYIKTKYGLSPTQYRKKWGLVHDYPMTAPNYSRQRSAMALGSGLGRKKN